MTISVALYHVESPIPRVEARRLSRELLEALLRKKGITFSSPLEIERDEHGRPFPKDPYLRSLLDLNVSHTENTIAVALAVREKDGEAPRIGIDVEIPHPRIRKLSLAERFFTENEQILLRSSMHLDEDFLHIWTRKEAYLKYLGTGLAGQMQSADTTCPASLSVTLETYPLTGTDAMLSLCLPEGVSPPKVEDFLVFREIP